MFSVVEQTYGDWELIVVDDGSTDGSYDMAAKVCDSRIKIVGQANAGVSAARNRGVAESCGEYICFLDADDWWEPIFLKEMSELIERHPDAGIYGTNYYIVKNGRKRVAPIGVDDGFVEGEINYCRVYAKTLCMPLWTGAVCMPRTVFDKTGRFPVGIKLGEDFLLWVHVALKHKVVLLNKPLSNYNQDVDVNHRGTHHLHNPKEHMLWHLEDLEHEEMVNPDYKQLIDNIRTYNLTNYLIDHRYREAAHKELAKVDWSRQPDATRRLYHMPIWMLHLYKKVLFWGAKIKMAIVS